MAAATNRPAWPWALVLFAGAALLLEIAGRGFSSGAGVLKFRPFSAPGNVPILEESILQWQVAHMLNLSEPQQILLLGDSSCLINLSATDMSRELGCKVWNLGLFAWLAHEGLVEVLGLYLEKHPPPRILVLHFYPYMLSEDLDERRHRNWLARWRAWAGKETGSDLLAGTKLLREQVVAALLSNIASLRGLDPEASRRVPRQPYPSDEDVGRELLENRGSLRCRDTWRPRDWYARGGLSAEARAGLVSLFELCAKQGIKLFVFPTPMPQSAESGSERGALERMETEIRTLSTSYRGVKMADPFWRFYPSSECLVLGHLTQGAASQNTAELTDWLQKNAVDGIPAKATE